MYGLSKDPKDKDKKKAYEILDDDRYEIYSVVRSRIKKKDLERERARLVDLLNLTEPTQEELLEVGRLNHPYYTRNIEVIQARIDEIDEILALKDK